jgi:hypothetical protein
MALIDNLEPGRNTDSANLAALLTSTQWTARELGTVRNVSVPNDTIWTATGNNPGLSRELADRALWIHLDPAHHDPSSRTNFQIPYIEDYAKEHQGISAELSLDWSSIGSTRGISGRGPSEDLRDGLRSSEAS